jgi:hypothetical protein
MQSPREGFLWPEAPTFTRRRGRRGSLVQLGAGEGARGAAWAPQPPSGAGSTTVGWPDHAAAAGGVGKENAAPPTCTGSQPTLALHAACISAETHVAEVEVMRRERDAMRGRAEAAEARVAALEGDLAAAAAQRCDAQAHCSQLAARLETRERELADALRLLERKTAMARNSAWRVIGGLLTHLCWKTTSIWTERGGPLVHPWE